jgi:hypothetical protein
MAECILETARTLRALESGIRWLAHTPAGRIALEIQAVDIGKFHRRTVCREREEGALAEHSPRSVQIDGDRVAGVIERESGDVPGGALEGPGLRVPIDCHAAVFERVFLREDRHPPRPGRDARVGGDELDAGGVGVGRPRVLLHAERSQHPHLQCVHYSSPAQA